MLQDKNNLFFKTIKKKMSVDVTHIRCSVPLYLQLFVEGRMSYLRHLCLFAYSSVQHI
jgi:hypothetical protein